MMNRPLTTFEMRSYDSIRVSIGFLFLKVHVSINEKMTLNDQ